MADTFGSYVLEERIAAGGMAEVFRALRVGAAGFQRRVCIKRILPAMAREQDFVQMFVDEARTGAQLRHGNIVAVDDFGEIDGQYFLCMEWVSGVDLGRLMRQVQLGGEPFPIDAALHVAIETLHALDYAHRKLGQDGHPLALVHRDVSPQNILVSHAGDVKLTDFGIAKAASRIHQTSEQVIKGKLAYMAPEQALGLPLDGRADLFALGVVLFEALAARRPFTGERQPALVHALLSGKRPGLRELRRDVPDRFTDVIEWLLATKAEDRCPSAHAALARLSALATGRDGARTLAGLIARFCPEHVDANGEKDSTRADRATVNARPARVQEPDRDAMTETRAEAVPRVSSPTAATRTVATRALRSVRWPLIAAVSALALVVLAALARFAAP